MASLDDLLRFIKLTHAFQQVRRVILVKNEERHENDLEHTCQLTLLAWFIIDIEHLDLDRDLVMKYALAHDLVEVYAGDTYAFTTNDKLLQNKNEREQAAAQRLQHEFPEFVDLHSLITEYENKQNRESRFVYALDKLLPALNIYLDDGRTWNLEGVTLKMLIDNKTNKIAHSPEIKRYFDEFVDILKRRELELFSKKS